MIEIDLERLLCSIINAAADMGEGFVTVCNLRNALHDQGLRYDYACGNLVPEDVDQVETKRKFRPGDLVVSKAGRYLTIECVGESGYGVCGGDGLCFPFGFEDQWDLVRPAEKEDGV